MPDLSQLLPPIPCKKGYISIGDINGDTLDCSGSKISTRLRNVILSNVNLKLSKSTTNEYGVRQQIDIFNSYFKNVCFDQCGTFEKLGGVFVNCSFRKTTLKDAALNGLYIGCNFNKTNFHRAFITGNFDNCSFENCNFHVACFDACFVNCTFKSIKIHPYLEAYNELFCGEPVSFTCGNRPRIDEHVKFHNERWPNENVPWNADI